MTRPVVTGLRAEHHRTPIGIGEAAPRLSWRTTAAPGWIQQRYDVEVRNVEGGIVDQRSITSQESILVPWPSAALRSRRRVSVRVRVGSTDGQASLWSPPLTVEAGLLRSADWQGTMIHPTDSTDISVAGPGHLLRRRFTVTGDVACARLYMTSHGCYEAQVNGQPVAGDVLAPGWTSYGHRLRYQTYDVTNHLQTGDNVLGATLADGWWRGRLGFDGGKRNLWGERVGLLAQLEIELTDGSRTTICTDNRWLSRRGPILAADLYDGEIYDARLQVQAWSQATGTSDGWVPVTTGAPETGRLVAPNAPPVRVVEERSPVEIITTPSGRTVLDFGQVVVGRIRIRVTGERGRRVVLRHAEVLEGGELCTRVLRGAAATDTYVLRGDASGEVWSPRFTLHGFRYAEVEGWPGRLDLRDVTAEICHSDIARSGWFSCSERDVEQLHENAFWSLRGNLVDVPTDCPQRDERLGWTGDLQVFAPSASFLMDVAGNLTTWLRDLAAEQEPDGALPLVVPDVLGVRARVAGWGDAAVIVPWVLYERTGDAGILAEQFDSMNAWASGEAELGSAQFGDWLDPASAPENPSSGRTDPDLVVAAYAARAAELTARAAGVLGRESDEARLRRLFEHRRDSFQRLFVTPGLRLASHSATACALVLCFDLVEDHRLRDAVARRLVDIVREAGHHVTTGFLGTPLLCDALCDVGAVDDAYGVLLQQGCPSFLYPVSRGATTIWERWDSLLPDGRINPGGMTSFNHYALGAVVDWLHRRVAGLAPAEPGYRRVRVAPLPGGGLTHASAAHDTPYGRAAVAWKRSGATLTVEATIPTGTRASVELPGEPSIAVASGTHVFTCSHRAADADPPPQPNRLHLLTAAQSVSRPRIR